MASTAEQARPHLGSLSSRFCPTPSAPPVHERLPKGGGSQSVLSEGLASSVLGLESLDELLRVLETHSGCFPTQLDGADLPTCIHLSQ